MRVTRIIDVTIYDYGKIVEVGVEDDVTFLKLDDALNLIDLLIRSQEPVSSMLRPADTNAPEVIEEQIEAPKHIRKKRPNGQQSN